MTKEDAHAALGNSFVFFVFLSLVFAGKFFLVIFEYLNECTHHSLLWFFPCGSLSVMFRKIKTGQ